MKLYEKSQISYLKGHFRLYGNLFYVGVFFVRKCQGVTEKSVAQIRDQVRFNQIKSLAEL